MIGDKIIHTGQWQVLVSFDAGWGRYNSVWPPSLTKTVLYSRGREFWDYEWGQFTGFHKYWT